jgi:hypothetical protein
MKVALRGSITTVFNNMILIMYTPIKNRSLSKFLFGNEGISRLKIDYDKVKGKVSPMDLYDIWFNVSMMRDLARNIFHGSVLCDITDNCSSLKSFY